MTVLTSFRVIYAEGVARSGMVLAWAWALAISVQAQEANRAPRFEDFPVTEIFKGPSAHPILTTPEERRFRTVIRQGVDKGWGVEDGIAKREVATPGPNFAGHYVIVKWGCGSPCLMVAIVDLRSGRVYPPPFHRPGNGYFQVPWAFPEEPALSYRLDSRLLVTNICEADTVVRINGQPAAYQSQRCGLHYFVIDKDGLQLIRRDLEPE